MAIQVVAQPDKLAWSNYTKTDNRPVDDDGNPVDAFTNFAFDIPVIRVHTVGQQLGFDRRPTGRVLGFNTNGSYTIKITPGRLQVWKKIQQTSDLLSHEQLHYDIGVIAARMLIADLATLQAPTPDDLRKAFVAAVDLHFKTRSKAVNHQYDADTDHGAKPQPQKNWKDAMKSCLDGSASTIMGLSF